MKNKKSTKELMRGAQFCDFSLRSKTKLAKTKKLAGFTLMELMVVIGIIGIMSAVFLASMSSTKSKTSLNAASAEVASAIKLAQSYALQGKLQGGTAVCGYGFRIDSANTYEIFYNPTVPPVNGSCSGQVNYTYYNSSVKAESYSLGNSLSFTSFPLAAVYFTVPHASIPVFPISIVLQYGGSGGSKKNVTIGSSGMVTEN